jgi:hypothetical protein
VAKVILRVAPAHIGSEEESTVLSRAI